MNIPIKTQKLCKGHTNTFIKFNGFFESRQKTIIQFQPRFATQRSNEMVQPFNKKTGLLIHETKSIYFAKSGDILQKAKILQNWFLPGFVTKTYISGRYQLQKQTLKYKIPIRNTCNLFIIYVFGSFCWLYISSYGTKTDKFKGNSSTTQAVSLLQEIVVNNLPLFQKNSISSTKETVENIILKKQNKSFSETFYGSNIHNISCIRLNTGQCSKIIKYGDMDTLEIQKDMGVKQISLLLREISIQNYIGRLNTKENFSVTPYDKQSICKTSQEKATENNSTTPKKFDTNTSANLMQLENQTSSFCETTTSNAQSYSIGSETKLRKKNLTTKAKQRELLFFARKPLCLTQQSWQKQIQKNQYFNWNYSAKSLFLVPGLDFLPRRLDRIDRNILFYKKIKNLGLESSCKTTPCTGKQQLTRQFHRKNRSWLNSYCSINFSPKLGQLETLQLCNYLNIPKLFNFGLSPHSIEDSWKPFKNLSDNYKGAGCLETHTTNSLEGKKNLVIVSKGNMYRLEQTSLKIMYQNKQNHKLFRTLSCENPLTLTRTNPFTDFVIDSRLQSGFNFPDAPVTTKNSVFCPKFAVGLVKNPHVVQNTSAGSGYGYYKRVNKVMDTKEDTKMYPTKQLTTINSDCRSTQPKVSFYKPLALLRNVKKYGPFSKKASAQTNFAQSSKKNILSKKKYLFLNDINYISPTASTSSFNRFGFIENLIKGGQKTYTFPIGVNKSFQGFIQKLQTPFLELVYKAKPLQGYISYDQTRGYIYFQKKKSTTHHSIAFTKHNLVNSNKIQALEVMPKLTDSSALLDHTDTSYFAKKEFGTAQKVGTKTQSFISKVSQLTKWNLSRSPYPFVVLDKNMDIQTYRIDGKNYYPKYTKEKFRPFLNIRYCSEQGHAPESFFGTPYLQLGERFTLEHFKGKNQMGLMFSAHTGDSFNPLTKPVVPLASTGTSLQTVFGKKKLTKVRTKKVQSPITNGRLVSQWSIADIPYGKTKASKGYSTDFLLNKPPVLWSSPYFTNEKRSARTTILRKLFYFKRISGKSNRHIINPFKYYNPGTKRDRNIEDTMLTLEGYKKSRLFPKTHAFTYAGINLPFLPPEVMDTIKGLKGDGCLINFNSDGYHRMVKRYPKQQNSPLTTDSDFTLWNPPFQSILGGMRQRTETQRIAQNVTRAAHSSSTSNTEELLIKGQTAMGYDKVNNSEKSKYEQEDAAVIRGYNKLQKRNKYRSTNCYPIRTLLTVCSQKSLSGQSFEENHKQHLLTHHFNTIKPLDLLTQQQSRFAQHPHNNTPFLQSQEQVARLKVGSFGSDLTPHEQNSIQHLLNFQGLKQLPAKPTDRTEYIFFGYNAKNRRSGLVKQHQMNNFDCYSCIAPVKKAAKIEHFPKPMYVCCSAQATGVNNKNFSLVLQSQEHGVINTLKTYIPFNVYQNEDICKFNVIPPTNDIIRGSGKTKGFYFENIFSFAIGTQKRFNFDGCLRKFNSIQQQNKNHTHNIYSGSNFSFNAYSSLSSPDVSSKQKVPASEYYSQPYANYESFQLLQEKNDDLWGLDQNRSLRQSLNTAFGEHLVSLPSSHIISRNLGSRYLNIALSFSKIVFVAFVWSSYKILAKGILSPSGLSSSAQFLPSSFTEAIGLQSFRQKYRIITAKKTTQSFKNLAGAEKTLSELRDLIWTFRLVGTGGPRGEHSPFAPLPYIGTQAGQKRSSVMSKARNRFLLVGPPGTGKTLLVKALAAEANVPVIVQPVSQLRMIAGVENPVSALFHVARQIKPCIIFLDELDTLGSNLHTSTTATTAEQKLGIRLARKYTYTLLLELDGLTSSTRDLLIIGATNRPETLNPALTRSGRFETFIHCNLPSQEQRVAVLSLYLSNYKQKVQNHKANLEYSKRLQTYPSRLSSINNQVLAIGKSITPKPLTWPKKLGVILNRTCMEFLMKHSLAPQVGKLVTKSPELVFSYRDGFVSKNHYVKNIKHFYINYVAYKCSGLSQASIGTVVNQSALDSMLQSYSPVHTLKTLERAIESVRMLIFPSTNNLDGSVTPIQESCGVTNLKNIVAISEAVSRKVKSQKFSFAKQTSQNKYQNKFSTNNICIKSQNLQFFLYRAYQTSSFSVLLRKNPKWSHLEGLLHLDAHKKKGNCTGFERKLYKNLEFNLREKQFADKQSLEDNILHVYAQQASVSLYGTTRPQNLKLCNIAGLFHKDLETNLLILKQLTSGVEVNLATTYNQHENNNKNFSQTFKEIDFSWNVFSGISPKNQYSYLFKSAVVPQKNQTQNIKQKPDHNLAEPRQQNNIGNFTSPLPTKIPVPCNSLAHQVQTSSSLSTGWFRMYLSRPIVRYDNLSYIENKEYYPQNNYVVRQCFGKCPRSINVATLAHFFSSFGVKNQNINTQILRSQKHEVYTGLNPTSKLQNNPSIKFTPTEVEPNLVQDQRMHGIKGKRNKQKLVSNVVLHSTAVNQKNKRQYNTPFDSYFAQHIQPIYLAIVAYSFHKASILFQANRELLDYCVYNKLRYGVIYEFSVKQTCNKF